MKKPEIVYFIKENKKLQKRIKKLEEILSEKNILKDVLSVKEVCENYDISTKTFDRYRRDKLIKVSQPKMNGKRFVKKSEIEKLLKIGNHAG